MSVTRWNPWGDMLSLRDAMSQLLEDSYVHQPGAAQSAGNLALDVWQDENSFEVSAALPGFKPEDVQITVQGDVLAIRAEHKQDAERKQGNYVVRERRSGSFYRAVQLPVMVNADKANAEFNNGVLHLTLPKAESVKPRTIRVQSGDTINSQARLSGANDNAATDNTPAAEVNSDSQPQNVQ